MIGWEDIDEEEEEEDEEGDEDEDEEDEEEVEEEKEVVPAIKTVRDIRKRADATRILSSEDFALLGTYVQQCIYKYVCTTMYVQVCMYVPVCMYVQVCTTMYVQVWWCYKMLNLMFSIQHDAGVCYVANFIATKDLNLCLVSITCLSTSAYLLAYYIFLGTLYT